MQPAMVSARRSQRRQKKSQDKDKKGQSPAPNRQSNRRSARRKKTKTNLGTTEMKEVSLRTKKKKSGATTADVLVKGAVGGQAAESGVAQSSKSATGNVSDPAPPGSTPETNPQSEVPNVHRPQLAGRDPPIVSPVQKEAFKRFVDQIRAAGVKGLMEEFDSIKQYNRNPFATDAHNANATKNRYKDIFCLDATRVKLNNYSGGEYIHANYVRGGPLITEFIATQGPTENTICDFWQMIVQENVGYIVMLCDVIELGKKKCERYFPEGEGEEKTFGAFTVSRVKVDITKLFIFSTLRLEMPNKEPRFIHHMQWKDWPDRGVPQTTFAAITILTQIRNSRFRTIVHCSAGVGRTGTLIAIEYVLQTIMSNPSAAVDLKEMLRFMRDNRAHSIQTAVQYVYVAQAIYRCYVETLLPAHSTLYITNLREFKAFCATIKDATPGAPPPPTPPANEEPME